MRKDGYSYLTSLVVVPTFMPGYMADEEQERNELPIADYGVEDEIPELPQGIDPPDLDAPRQTRSKTRARLSNVSSTQTTIIPDDPQMPATPTNSAAGPAGRDGSIELITNDAPRAAVGNGVDGAAGSVAPNPPVINLDSDEDDRAIRAGIHGPPQTIHRVHSNASIASNQSAASRASSSKSLASSSKSLKSQKAAGKKPMGHGDNASATSLKVLASLSAKLKKGKIPLREKKEELLTQGANSNLAFQRSMRDYHLYRAHALASEVVALQENEKLQEKANQSQADARKHNIVSKSVEAALEVKEAGRVNKRVGKAREKAGNLFVRNHDAAGADDSDVDDYDDAVETSSIAERLESLQPFGDDDDDEDVDVDEMVIDSMDG
ncbi:hypothetical protein SCHPADRAFT_896393 [Schizopora paradoxa]|uniref:Uncharacterized protein n=1 Tax=Schizopora paradoxa TaxID=27342 RepID=A0A0H2R704_9AGAM|nr:hypothetical protein SCHPADRAFT_896393 [Schizopora paradoxa]